MKNKIEKRNRKMAHILVIAFIVFGIIYIIYTSIKPIIYVDLLKIAETTQGEVIRAYSYKRTEDEGERYVIRYQYEVDSQYYTIEHNKGYDLGYDEGDSITIYYMLSDPEKAGIYEIHFRP